MTKLREASMTKNAKTSSKMTSKASGTKTKCQGQSRKVNTASSIVSANATMSETWIEYVREVSHTFSSTVNAKATAAADGRRGKAAGTSSSSIAYSGRQGKKTCTCTASSSIASANAKNCKMTHKGRQGKKACTASSSIASASANATSFETTYKERRGKKVCTTSSIASASTNATSFQMAHKGRQGKVHTTSSVSAMTSQFHMTDCCFKYGYGNH